MKKALLQGLQLKKEVNLNVRTEDPFFSTRLENCLWMLRLDLLELFNSRK